MKKVLLMAALLVSVAATSCKKDVIFDDEGRGTRGGGGKTPACESVMVDEGPFENIAGSETHVMGAWIEGDNLKLKVGYSGCSNDHNFDLHWNKNQVNVMIYPAQVVLQLADNDGIQMCNAYFQETLCFDISKLKTGAHGEMLIKLQGHENADVMYKY